MFPSGFIKINADHQKNVHLTTINSVHLHYSKNYLKNIYYINMELMMRVTISIFDCSYLYRLLIM